MAIDKKKLQTEGTYQAQAPLRSILEDVDQIDNFLQEIESERRKLRKFGGIFMAGGIVLAIVGGVVGINVLSFLAFLAFTTGVGLFIYSFVYGRAMHGHQNRCRLLKELFGVHQQDADPRSSFSVRLALKPQPTKLKDEPWPLRKDGREQYFKEEYLSIEGELLDGTFLSESLTELTRKRTFKNPRGKPKVRTRSRYILALKFRYPSDVYRDARAAQQALHEEIRVPSSANVRETSVDEKAITVKSMILLDREIVQASAMSCLGAYRILNLARRLAATGGAQ
jgi:hypothetical protein